MLVEEGMQGMLVEHRAVEEGSPGEGSLFEEHTVLGEGTGGSVGTVVGRVAEVLHAQSLGDKIEDSFQGIQTCYSSSTIV